MRNPLLLRPSNFHMRALGAVGAAVLAAIAGQAVAGAANAGVAGAPTTPAANPAAAPAGGPGRWTQVTPSGTSTVADIGLARGSDGVLHVI
jgi:hypothetical protein